MNLAVERIAEQAASFMVAGFVHGVLNSDNINITGESFDYGPWRFTEFWDPAFTAAYFDHSGLYAFGRQAEAMHWDLAQLAISLRLISEAPPLVEALERFPGLFQAAIIRRFLWRLGVQSRSEADDRALVEAGERAMIADRILVADFFKDHRGGANSGTPSDAEALSLFREKLRDFSMAEGADRPLPDCTMLIDEVEGIWASIAQTDDWQPMYRQNRSDPPFWREFADRNIRM